MALSVATMAGMAPRAVLPALWVGYLALVVAGQDFLSFQWDVLLLETGLLAVLYAPAGRRVPLGTGDEPNAAGRWLVWGPRVQADLYSPASPSCRAAMRPGEA